MNQLSCEHVAAYKKERGTTTYQLIHAFFIACVTQEARERKIQDCYCYTCKTRSYRIHACLSCVFFGCYDNNHIQEHADAVRHYIAVDTSFGHVYCFLCQDYMYDYDFEQVAKQNKKSTGNHYFSGNLFFTPWHPNETEMNLMKDNEKTLHGNLLGLRGMVNLGQTCYMNCIVQVLTHNPLLINYFLADKHNVRTCHYDGNRSACLACELSELFQEFYSGESAPYIPHQLVYIIWKHAKHLDGNKQQDAHEFFITMLDVLHQHLKGKNDDELNCRCIIHQIFTGYFQSDLICLSCRTASTKKEAFRDICLDLGATTSGSGSEKISLKDCLERYTLPEQLQITCESCHQHCTSTKQLTVQKLPVLMSFHLRRLGFGKKITTFVSFPEFLDMTPFISSMRGGKSSETNGESHISDHNHSNNHFCLFAVVNHSGNKEGGHYISFIKMHHSWYKCDDDIITAASVNDVLISEGYLLFYHKEILEYEENQTED